MEIQSELEREWIKTYCGFVRKGNISNDRAIIITPYDGAYGIAGYILVVEGSPPPLIIMVQVYNFPTRISHLYVLDQYRVTRLRHPDRFALNSKSLQKKLWILTEEILKQRIDAET